MQIFGTKAVTLVGASEFRKKDLLDCLDFAPTLIAVDGGANNLQDLKIFARMRTAIQNGMFCMLRLMP